MRRDPKITALGLACFGLLLAAAPAFAQSQLNKSSAATSNSFSSSSPSTSSSSNSGSLFGNSSSFGANSSGNTSMTGSNSFLGGTPGTQTGTTGTQIGTTGRTGTTVPGATSFLGANYANPLAMGIGTGTSVARFGSAMYTITSNQTGTATVNTANLGNQTFGAGFNIRRLPSYATTLKIKDMPPPPTAGQVQTDLQAMFIQSPQLDSRDAIRVVIDGQTVVLQGEVVGRDAEAADDERRLVENMVRLTPRVGPIRNEVSKRVVPQ